MKSWFQFLFSIALILFTISTFAESSSPTGAYGRMIVFGDSLSDVGTYSAAAGPLGGGKFTTNPGKIWAEVVAEKFGLEMKPNRHEGFGLPIRELGGFNYAQGGSRIVYPRQKPGDGDRPTLTSRPLVEQVGIFLMKHQQFKSNDLVMIQGGANDVFVQLSGVQSGKLKPEEALANVAQAAEDLTVIIANLKASQAVKVVVLNLPAIEKTPRVILLDPQSQQFVASLVATFNRTLAQGIEGLETQLVDINKFDRDFNQNYEKLGFKDISHAACKAASLPLGSSLFCSSKSLVEKEADLKFKFADEIHPTTGYSKMVSEFILNELTTAQ